MKIQSSLFNLMFSLSFMLGIGLACQEGDDTADDSDCVPGMEGCACTPDGLCFGELGCYSGVCVSLPGSSGETGNGSGGNSSTNTGDGDGDGDGDPDSGDGDGDGDGESGDACIQSYNSCWDFDAGAAFGDCCPGTACLYDTLSVVSGCVPECELHSECLTDCCVETSTQITLCSPTTAICNEYGKCIDTCEWAGDGWCDDGGPDASYDVCEYGTDCTDCGARF